MEIQQIADVLLQWGPAGAVAILIIIAEKKLRSRWDATKGKDHRMCAWLYLGNWVFIAALLTIVSTVWVIDKNRTRITMSGIVQDLSPPFNINDPEKELFTKKTLKSPWLYDVHWHYSNTQIPDVLEIRLENKTDFQDYEIPLVKVSNIMDIRIIYKNEKLWLKTPKKLVELHSNHSASSELKVLPSTNGVYKLKFISEVVADEVVAPNLILGALESDDSYIRQSASQYLVDNIETMQPLIESQLTSNDTSLITKSGIITALARASSPDLRENKNWVLSEDAEHEIFSSIFSDDDVIATQSRRYIIRNLSPKYIVWLERECKMNKEYDASKREYCAFVGLNLIYNLAIQYWVESKNKPIDVALEGILKSIEIIDQGGELWEEASREKKIQFGKIIYGKALFAHEISKLYKKMGMKNEKDSSQQKAIDYFKDMLTYIEENDTENFEYEYPHHVKQAKCYIYEPKQQCFDKYAP